MTLGFSRNLGWAVRTGYERLSRLKEMALYYSMQMSADKRNNNANQQEANGPIATGRSSGYIPGSRKKKLYIIIIIWKRRISLFVSYCLGKLLKISRHWSILRGK